MTNKQILIPCKPISEIKLSRHSITIQPFALLDIDYFRMGHLTRNVGSTPVILLYGAGESQDRFGTRLELYRVALAPGNSYLHDVPEIIPFQVIASGAAELLVIEFY